MIEATIDFDGEANTRTVTLKMTAEKARELDAFFNSYALLTGARKGELSTTLSQLLAVDDILSFA